jgi:hypothetical protein
VKWQAQLTFAISRHAVADLSEIFRLRLHPPVPDRLPPQDLAELRALLMETGGCKCTEGSDLKLAELRSMYEPQLAGLSRRLLMPVPSWGVGASFVKPKKKTAWDRITSDSTAPVTSVDKESSHF